MVSVLLSVLFVSAGAFSVLVLVDSALRGMRAYRVLKADMMVISQNRPKHAHIAVLQPASVQRPRPAVRAIRANAPRLDVQEPFFARPVAA